MFDVQLQRPITLKLNSIDDSVLGYIGFVIEDGVVDSIPSLEIMDHPNILTYVPQVSVGEVCERSRLLSLLYQSLQNFVCPKLSRPVQFLIMVVFIINILNMLVVTSITYTHCLGLKDF